MKKVILVLCLLMMSGCFNNEMTEIFNDEELAYLEENDVYEEVKNDCENKESVKAMLSNNFDHKKVKSYCSLNIKDGEGVNELLDAGLSTKEVQEYIDVDYFHGNKVDRYLKQKGKTVKEKILKVNMNLDLPPYSTNIIIEDDSDLTLLVNKYSALPEGYVPSDLVDVNYVCEQGVHYSCSTMSKMQLREEAAKAYEKFVEAAKKEDIDIVAIATYRSYDYQYNLWSYNKNLYGIEYADEYYARAGQSEHNTGLAVDITFNNHPYNEIEKYEGYDWILKNMHKYGFILRYPEDKVEYTKYGYESWHIRYVGKKLAKHLYENDLTLDEYYGMK